MFKTHNSFFKYYKVLFYRDMYQMKYNVYEFGGNQYVKDIPPCEGSYWDDIIN